MGFLQLLMGLPPLCMRPSMPTVKILTVDAATRTTARVLHISNPCKVVVTLVLSPLQSSHGTLQIPLPLICESHELERILEDAECLHRRQHICISCPQLLGLRNHRRLQGKFCRLLPHQKCQSSDVQNFTLSTPLLCSLLLRAYFRRF